MTPAPLADAAAREAIRSELGTCFVVEAAAGTGKTTELVRRITAALAEGLADVGSLVAVTFTEKAAGELKLRLRTALEKARQSEGPGPRREALTEAVAHLEEARIGTIHAFCSDLLRERPVEARLDPDFAPMTEGEAARLFNEVFDRWLEGALAAPGPGLSRALRRRGRGEGSAVSRLRRAAWDLVELRDFPAPWTKKPWARQDELESLADALVTFGEQVEQKSRREDRLYDDLLAERRLAAELRRRRAATQLDLDELEAELAALSAERAYDTPRYGNAKWTYGGGLNYGQLAENHRALLARVSLFVRHADAELAAELHDELCAVTQLYEERKARAGRLDFLDLLLRARDLLLASPSVRAAFQSRFSRLFVDEFQDTDPLQAEVLMLLAGSDPSVTAWRDVWPVPGKLFVVGDPKQAIYRFRRADLAIYEEVKQLVVARGGRLLHLASSFRGVPALQAAQNAAFAPQMPEGAPGVQAVYVPLAPVRAAIGAQPALVVLPVPRPYGVRNLTKRALEASLPSAVAALVKWLVDAGGMYVTERGGEAPVPLAARHVCLLFRRFTAFGEDATRPYVAALEAKGVPHVLVGGRSFHDREEVETMVAALSAVEHPDDELAVYATLRGSLFALSDEHLLEYRVTYRGLHPFRAPAPEAIAPHLAPMLSAFALLRELHRKRNRRSVADTVSALIENTRAHAAFALRPSGEQALANVLWLVELGRTYDATQGLSFRGFVEHLREQAEARVAPEAAILEESSDGVRLMTVHKAKGLEFPVVILVDPTAKLTQGRASRHVDAARGLAAVELFGLRPWDLLEHEADEIARDAAEAVRLVYVAATRARDLLVVPMVGDRPSDGADFPKDGWLAPLAAALVPPRGASPLPHGLAGAPAFGEDSVLERPNFEGPDARTVLPGRHVFPGYDVVWWDPSRLDLVHEAPRGVPHKDLLEETSAEVIEEGLATYRSYRAERDAAISAASTPALTVTTATAFAEAHKGESALAEVPVHEVPRLGERPRGAAFGALVHAVLAVAPLGGDGADLSGLAALEARVLALPTSLVAPAAEAARRALLHPLMLRAAEAERRGECRRETPLAFALDDGAVVEGVVDLAFREGGRWLVVDFKTDAVLGPSLGAYTRQVALYAEGIRRATGEPADAALLWI
jgi:ATP-dependent helicase/nuclease subunit A